MDERREKSPDSKKRRGGNAFPALLCNILGTALIFAVILLMLPSFLPQLMGIRVYNVVSGSMAPTIPVGSMIFVAPADGLEIEEGDVIAFLSNGVVVTHRVVENRKLERKFITKGDANVLEDMNRIDHEELLGRVEYHVPMLGDVTAHVTTPLGKVYLFAVIVCGLLFNMIAGRLRNR